MSAVNHTRERRGANSVLYLVRETVCGSRSSMSISRMAGVCTNQASAIVMRKKVIDEEQCNNCGIQRVNGEEQLSISVLCGTAAIVVFKEFGGRAVQDLILVETSVVIFLFFAGLAFS